jgi:hypothetical protein
VISSLPDPVRRYLCVDQFLEDMVGARALATAFETGTIDLLAELGAPSIPEFHARLKKIAAFDEIGLQFLLSMLHANGVVERDYDSIRLSDAFVKALEFRDLLETKLHFAHLVSADFQYLLTALLVEPAAFTERARLFKLFSYDRSIVPNPENYESTGHWMRLTTVLTKYESGACIAAHDFSGVRRMLDVGGNSGEFARQVCMAYPLLQAVVYDLPLVCDIGASHLSSAPEATRIQFVRRSDNGEALPRGCDLISFKSMLHDWPEKEMSNFLVRAHAALEDGGKLLIFERSQWDGSDQRVTYGQLPVLLFFRSYRSPSVYMEHLRVLGFHSINVKTVMLDMPFTLITCTK